MTEVARDESLAGIRLLAQILPAPSCLLCLPGVGTQFTGTLRAGGTGAI